MLKQILSITGKPGLFRIITHGSRMLLVEDIASGKRMPAHSRDRIVALGDIAMYTDNGDTPLGEILDKVYAAQDGKAIDIKALETSKGFRDKFGEIVEDYDRDRVYESDIKKLFTWYNILINAGFTRFTEDEKTEETEEKKD